MATLTGTDGDDTLEGGGGRDTLLGLDGDDLLRGGGHEDEICGEAGSDSLFGGSRVDDLDGGEGPDRLLGGDANDWLFGGAGHDRLLGGTGSDTLTGGASNDRFVFDRIDPDPGADRITDFTQGRDHIVFKREQLGPDGSLTFIGTDGYSGEGRGEIRYHQFHGSLDIFIDRDGDGITDLAIMLDGRVRLTADDFLAG